MTACRFPDIDKLKALRCARSVEWDDPYGGVCRDEFVLGEGGHSLTQVSDMTIRGSGRRCQYRRAGTLLSRVSCVAGRRRQQRPAAGGCMSQCMRDCELRATECWALLPCLINEGVS